MLSAADALGCDSGDIACLCSEPRFVYGVRDCSNEYCSNSGDANTVQEFGKNMCASAGVAISGIPGEVTASGTQSTTVVATASPTVSSFPSLLPLRKLTRCLEVHGCRY